MRISSSTNSRTTIATYLRALPAGDSVFFFRSNLNSLHDVLAVVGFLGTFAFDYQARGRLGGLNMSEFLMVETALPLRRSVSIVESLLLELIAGLALPSTLFAPEWLTLRVSPHCSRDEPWRARWALTPHERLRRRCTLDAVVAALYGLEYDDVLWILRGCDWPRQAVTRPEFAGTLDGKGFWRIDKEEDPELRHTVLTAVAFHELASCIEDSGGVASGVQAFCAQNGGAGWSLPDTIRLGDYGLGHDTRAEEAQPVAARLGPRFLPWQLEQSVEESWLECEGHARAILGQEGFERLQAELRGDAVGTLPDGAALAAEGLGPSAGRAQRRLFPGEQTLFGPKAEDAPRARRRTR
jgi:hypothetical protein